MGLFVSGQRCDLIDIARSISVAIAFYGGKKMGIMISISVLQMDSRI